MTRSDKPVRSGSSLGNGRPFGSGHGIDRGRPLDLAGARQRLTALAMLTLFCGLLVGGGVSAQAGRYDGAEIREVQFLGLDTLSAETMEHYLLGRKTEDVRRLDLAELN